MTESALAKTPTPRVYQIDGNDLLVVKIPLKDPYSGGLDVQTCFVWRDATYRTATITCPQSPDPDTDNSFAIDLTPEQPKF